MISLRNIAPLQAVKTGVAAGAAIYAASLLKLPQGYWAAISAIVVMQSEVSATLKVSRNRLIGTAIGASLGALFVPFGEGRLAWFGATVAVTVLVCQFLGLEQSYRLACVTVAIVMLVNPAGSPWPLALHRFEEVALGIVVALAVSAIPVDRRQLHNPRTNV
jgi:uncharacterized membrane protein YgaE (UPF0421/DUF939 family)